MTHEQRLAHAPRRLPLLLAVLAAIVTAGCAGGSARSPDSRLGPAATAEAAEGDQHGADEEHDDEQDEPLLSPGADPGDSVTTQSDTDWGPIWDRLPDDFPIHPATEPSDDGLADDPVSGTYLIAGVPPDEIAPWMQAALEDATYSTEALSGPHEDGSYVLDSVGDADCRIEATMAPIGDGTVVTVRYGADCPNE
jgi:hypothetical protein